MIQFDPNFHIKVKFIEYVNPIRLKVKFVLLLVKFFILYVKNFLCSVFSVICSLS
ncbi:hypothetical protein IMPERIA75_130090 [Imperialibacter sp. 75]|nr:hypothetical protein IMPERIA75_130090 [Imperialibacter sp. 75]